MSDQPDDPYASPPPGWQPPAQQPPPGWQPPPFQQSPPYAAPPGQPYAAPPPYGMPPQQYPPYGYAPSGYYPAPSTTNGFAIASLVCAIVLAVLFGIGSVLGVGFGIVGLRQCRAHHEGGRGLAIAGIVIGGIGILFWLLVLVGLLADSTSSSVTVTNIGVAAIGHPALR